MNNSSPCVKNGSHTNKFDYNNKKLANVDDLLLLSKTLKDKLQIESTDDDQLDGITKLKMLLNENPPILDKVVYFHQIQKINSKKVIRNMIENLTRHEAKKLLDLFLDVSLLTSAGLHLVEVQTRYMWIFELVMLLENNFSDSSYKSVLSRCETESLNLSQIVNSLNRTHARLSTLCDYQYKLKEKTSTN